MTDRAVKIREKSKELAPGLIIAGFIILICLCVASALALVIVLLSSRISPAAIRAEGGSSFMMDLQRMLLPLLILVLALWALLYVLLCITGVCVMSVWTQGIRHVHS